MSMIIDGTSGVTFPNSTVQASAGNVLQVVNATLNTSVSTTSATYVDTGLSASITPKFSTSKILVIVSLNNVSQDGGDLTFLNLLRGSTTLINNNSGGGATTAQAWATGGGAVYTGNNRQISNPSLQYLDSPSTTSSTTYKIQIKRGNGGTSYLNQWALNSDNAGVSSITLMEIAQ